MTWLLSVPLLSCQAVPHSLCLHNRAFFLSFNHPSLSPLRAPAFAAPSVWNILPPDPDMAHTLISIKDYSIVTFPEHILQTHPPSYPCLSCFSPSVSAQPLEFSEMMKHRCATSLPLWGEAPLRQDFCLTHFCVSST